MIELISLTCADNFKQDLTKVFGDSALSAKVAYTYTLMFMAHIL